MTTDTITRLEDAAASVGAADLAPARVRLRRDQRMRAIVKHVLLVIVGMLMIYPLLWMVSSSFKPNDLIFSSPGLIPERIDLSNYTDGWNALTHPFGHYILNSAIIVAGSLVGNLVSCTMAAYAFARLKFRSRPFLFAVMLLTLMLPVHVLIVPQYVLFSNIGWLNTFLPLIVPKFLATDAFFIFLMVQFFRGIPNELEEAARIDGAGYWRTFLQIMLPLTIPALATTAIFTFIWTWNDFYSQLIFLTAPDMRTVPVALSNFVDTTSASSWGQLFAMSVITLLPLFVVFLVGQRFLLRGIATTGLK
ncbi:carbohydrate ABC transporter permease [Microbacterium sp. M]|uniref:carbohydrate ABC transporter permease n=1 Tax=Microbacterium sp. M TaxID=3377125 RepID=UPI00386F4780